MFYELLITNTIWFWLIFAVLTMFTIIMIRVRSESCGVFALGLFLLVWLLFGDLAEWIRPNPLRLLWYPLSYVVVGFGWCVPKWLIFLDKIKRTYIEKLIIFLKGRKTDKLSKDDWKDWSALIGYNPYYDAGMSFSSATGVLTPPQFSNNKERIAGWVILWPFSMLDTLLGDVLKRIVDKIVSLYKRLFQAISDWMFRGL